MVYWAIFLSFGHIKNNFVKLFKYVVLFTLLIPKYSTFLYFHNNFVTLDFFLNELFLYYLVLKVNKF